MKLRSRPSCADPKIVDRALDGDRNIYFGASFLDTAPPEKFTENRTNFQTFHFQNNFGFLWKKKKMKILFKSPSASLSRMILVDFTENMKVEE